MQIEYECIHLKHNKMDILKMLTPEQFNSLTEKQLNILLGVKKSRTPELKALINQIEYITHYGIYYGATYISPKILEILFENLDETYYIIGKLHDGVYKDYKLFTYDDLSIYVNSTNDLNKMVYSNIAQLKLVGANGWLTTSNGPSHDKNIYNSIISKAKNVVAINPVLFRAFALFKGNIDEVNAFLTW